MRSYEIESFNWNKFYFIFMKAWGDLLKYRFSNCKGAETVFQDSDFYLSGNKINKFHAV